MFLQNAEVVRAEARRPLSEDAQFLLDSACKEHTKSVGAKPVHIKKMDEIYGVGKWSGLPCFCATQASGKRRRIDNGKRSWTNKATSYSEEFQMNNASFPGIAASAVREVVQELGEDKVLSMIADLESGGEDIPNPFALFHCF